MQVTQETFTWFRQDAEWKNKFLIGSAFALAATFVPVLGWLGHLVIYGYGLIVMRAVMRGEPPTLPKWERYGELFVDGLKAGLASIGYFVPSMLAGICAYGFMLTMIFTEVATHPNTGRVRPDEFPVPIIIGYVGFFGLFSLAMFLFVLTVLPMTVAVGQYARTGQVGAGYRFREVWQILRANVGGFVIALLIYFAIAFGLGLALQIVYMTIILCCLVPFIMAPITFYLSLMWGYLFGMAYREGIIKAGIATSQA